MTGRKMGGRLLGALETIVDPQRLARGRTVARSGAVTVVDRRQGWTMARVRGTQLQPFTAGLWLRPLTDDERAAVRAAVTAAPGVLTAVAAGRMPPELQELLLPVDSGDVRTDCDCPDRIPTCRHVAGLMHTVAAGIDDDPVQLFALRGLPLTRLVDEVAAGGAAGEEPGGDRPDTAAAEPDLFRPATGLPPAPDTAGAPRRGAADLLDPAWWRTAVAAAGGDRAQAAAELDRLYQALRGGAGQWDDGQAGAAPAR